MRRLIIGAVAVGTAAVFAAAAVPAHATHDMRCLPPVTSQPICVAGIEHEVDKYEQRVEETRQMVLDEAWAAFQAVWPTATAPSQQAYEALGTIPEPLCAPDSEVCAFGVRAAAQELYDAYPANTLRAAGYFVCIALERPWCPFPI